MYLGSDPVTGKQRYASRTVRGRERAAQRVLAEMVTEAERGLSVRTNATAGELIEAWFEQASRDFSPKTVKETWVHRPQPAAGDRHRSAVEAQGKRPRPPLPAAASVRSGGWRRVGPGDRASHPRHSSAGTRPGGQVGMGRCQSRRGDEPTTRAPVGDQATLRTRPRSCAAASDGVIAGAGLFPGARRRNRGKTLGARGPCGGATSISTTEPCGSNVES